MSIYQIGPFHLNVEQLLLMHESKPVALGPKVVETLLALVEHPGEVLTKRVLVDRIWPEGFVEEANLAQNIHALRKTFSSHACPDLIETVPRRGYRFIGPVRQLAHLPHAYSTLRGKRGRTPRIAAAIAGAACLVAFLVLGAGNGFGNHGANRPALSEKGARLYQIGRYYWNLRTRDGVRKSLSYFTQVVDSDPNDARGYAALAEANVTMGDYCYGTHRPAVYYARAQEYAGKALALDPDSAEAHAALGVLALDRKDVTAAVAELQRAIAIDPSYAPAQEWYGIVLLRHGRSAEGAAHLRLAADLDPLSVATTAWLGSAAYQQRRFGDAIAYSQQALELSPDRTDSLATIGRAYETQGDVSRAIAAFKRYAAVSRLYHPEAAALLAHAYALGHQMPEARAQFAYAHAHATEVDPADLATAAAAVGDHSGTQRKGRAHHAATYA